MCSYPGGRFSGGGNGKESGGIEGGGGGDGAVAVGEEGGEGSQE
jgi:hypothetical protein